MKSKYIFFIVFSLLAMPLFAQEKVTKETQSEWQVLVTGGGGRGYLNYDAPTGDNKKGMGYMMEIQFQHISKLWGCGIGIQLGSLNNTLNIGELNTEEEFVHPDNGLEYTLQTKFQNLKETQKVTMLAVPLEVIRRAALSDVINLQIGFGGFVGLNCQSEYSVKSGKLTTEGYFPATNVTYSNMLNHGFGDYDLSGSDEIKTNLSFGLRADIGVVYRLTPASGLYLGAYLQSGFNHFTGKERDALYDGSSYCGYLNSHVADYGKSFQAGFMIGVIMGPRY